MSHHLRFFNNRHQLCESKAYYCLFILCSFIRYFLYLLCTIVQVQETNTVLFGILCNHTPSVQFRQEVHVLQNRCARADKESPVGMSQLYEQQHYQELLHRRSISPLVFLLSTIEIEFIVTIFALQKRQNIR